MRECLEKLGRWTEKDDSGGGGFRNPGLRGTVDGNAEVLREHLGNSAGMIR